MDALSKNVTPVSYADVVCDLRHAAGVGGGERVDNLYYAIISIVKTKFHQQNISFLITLRNLLSGSCVTPHISLVLCLLFRRIKIFHKCSPFLCFLYLGSAIECKKQPMIRWYLIVFGYAMLLQCIIYWVYLCRTKDGTSDAAGTVCCSGIVKLFQFIWFICGCVWVYGIFEPNYTDRNSEQFCSELQFKFAFWLNNSIFIFYGIYFIYCCCKGLLSTEETENPSQRQSSVIAAP